MRLELPPPPSANHYVRHARGHHYKSAKTLAYELAVQAAWYAAGRPLAPEPPYRVTLDAYGCRPDAGSLEKVPVDALFRLLHIDDREVRRLEVTKWPLVRRERARLILVLETWEG